MHQYTIITWYITPKAYSTCNNYKKWEATVCGINLCSTISSLGLAIPPRIRFLKREEKRQAEREQLKKVKGNNVQESEDHSASDSAESDRENLDNLIASPSEESSESDSDDDDDDNDDDNDDENRKSDLGEVDKTNPTAEDKSQNLSHEKDSRTKASDAPLSFDVDDDNDDLFTVKRTVLESDSDSDEDGVEKSSVKGDKLEKSKKKEKSLTKYAIAKKLQKKNLKVNTKVVFDEEGEVRYIPG